ncbi:MAG: V-type ATPase subunit [Oscillospiraceae bacterium]|nr:V-type ATPase subunit [Oscillospiraceae bacterium]
MIGALLSHGAAAAKVRAMYAKRLTPEDFARIAAQRTVPDVVQFLKAHPGWRGAFDASFDETRRGPLEEGLRRHLLSEYTRIIRFIAREDRFITYDRILQSDMEQIMRFLRYAQVGRADDYRPDLPPSIYRQSRIDYDLLSHASTYEEMMQAVAGARFHGALSRLPLVSGGFPDYMSVEMIMRNHYYRELMNLVDKRYRGREYKLLREAVGAQADMINLTIIMRVRKFFPGQRDAVLPMLLPVRYKLTPAYVNRLYTAQTDESAEALLREGPYGKRLDDRRISRIEDFYYRFLFDFNRRILKSGIPTVYTPSAYLGLRDVELRNLIAAIECVRYGVSPDKAPAYLFGVPM